MRQHRRPGWYQPGLLLLPAALLLIALYSVTRSSIFSADHSQLGTLDTRRPEKAQAVAAHNLLETTAEHQYRRHSSLKLETLPEPLPLEPQDIPVRTPTDPVQASNREPPPDKSPQQTRREKTKMDAPLVVYQLLEDSDPENEANFQHYLREGIQENDGCTHIVLVDPSRDVKSLPRLPLENAKYLKRSSNSCLWGAWGEFLSSPDVQLSKHTSFILLTSRLRGPFLPAYAQEYGVSWPSLLAAKLSNRTKLAGPLISCQDVDWPAHLAEEKRPGQPYFPEHMLATDQVGLKLLQAADVFTCHERSKVPNPERFSAVMAARAVLDAGFNLDCLLQRYQGAQWAEKENWGCNARLRVDGGENYYDGVSVHPMEVMFVEVTGMLLRKGVSTARAAKKYDSWQSWQAVMKRDLAFNMYAFDPMPFRAPRIAYMEKRGPGCFDFGYYSQQNPEVQALSLGEKWDHFVQSGQFEERNYRFNCVDVLARSFNCFDHEYYNRANEDLNELRLEGRPLSPQQAWAHFLNNGFFEQRSYRFMDICGEDIDSPNNMGEGM